MEQIIDDKDSTWVWGEKSRPVEFKRCAVTEARYLGGNNYTSEIVAMLISFIYTTGNIEIYPEKYVNCNILSISGHRIGINSIQGIWITV